jgi:hypothetical protein
MSQFDDEELTLLKDALKRSVEGINQSDFFCSLFTKSVPEDPVAVLQIGLMLILDKPLFLLAPDDMPIPMNLKRLAINISRYQEGNSASYAEAAEDMKRAMTLYDEEQDR